MKNLGSLACIQGANALVPLLMFPYLMLNIGENNFAKLVTIEAASFIVLTIGLYSFDVLGIKLIAKISKKGEHVRAKVYYSILYARMILFAIAGSIFIIITYFVDRENIGPSVVWLMFPLGVILQSSYYYQTTNNNFPLAIFIILSRTFACIVMLIYINANSDLMLASAVIAFSYLISGIASYVYLLAHLKFISPFKVRGRTFAIINQGKSVFAGGVSVILYRGSNVLLLAALNASPLSISIYAISEKYIKMIQAITMPITQILSVKAIRALVEQEGEKELIKDVLWRNTKPQVAVGLLIIITLLMIGFIAYDSIGKMIPVQAIYLIAMMLPATIFGIVNHMYGTIAYCSLNFDRLYANILLIFGVLSIIASAFLIKTFESVGAASAFLLSEAALSVAFICILKSKLN